MSNVTVESKQAGSHSEQLALKELPKQHVPLQNCQSSTRRGLKHRIRDYALTDLQSNSLAEVQLLLLTFSTGIQDAVSFPDFLCFASNQTGNTVLLVVGLAGFRGEYMSLANIGASLGCFLAGAIIMGQLGNKIGARRRWWQLCSNVIQTAMVFGAAAIQFVNGIGQGDEHDGQFSVEVIALLALASGAQVATARAFKLTEISTAMATAAWVDLVIDPHLLAFPPSNNAPRNRRFFFLLALVAGCFAGAYLRRGIGSPLSLTVSAIIKGVTLILILMPARQKQQYQHYGNAIMTTATDSV